jgi:uncharacterized protein (TIGR01777 family)
MSESFVARCRLPVNAETAYRWHASPGAFERLSPPWSPVRVVHRSGEGIEPGTRVEMKARIGPIPIRWVAIHGPAESGRFFEDRQVSGPFSTWRHVHRFHPEGESACSLEDRIEYTLPMGPLGATFGGAATRSMLDRLFARRHAVTVGDLERHSRFGRKGSLRIAITGATGLVGVSLEAFLSAGGHHVVRVVRSHPTGRDVFWDPGSGQIESEKMEGLDAVVHLAGENIAASRWTASRKDAIRASRVRSTRLLAETLAKLRTPPSVLISASAVGFYGSRGGDAVDESTGPGDGFLPDVCRAWESAAEPASAAGIRVVHLRLGVVLAANGGALEKMLLPFLMGGGGAIGSGRQGMSWVALDDVLGAIHFVLTSDGLSGACNVTSPHPIPQREFAKTLARVLRRPAVVPMPSIAVRLLFGEMGERLLLEGAFVIPARLQGAGFPFRWPVLEDALRFELGRN